MRSRIAALALLAFAMACATTAPPRDRDAEALQGVASWYGEEFAGRTTANGEIFDPLQLTAAHRTLPFGTVLDITNPKTNQTVRVRVNDRGPYIAGRVIDLSYAAAQQIGLIEPGIGEVKFAIVKIGSGEREPPAPLEVTIAEAPAVPLPLPEPVVVDRVEVVETRKQVSADGTTIERVPVTERGAASQAASAPPVRRLRTGATRFIVQVGAFAVEANAKLLMDRLVRIGQDAWIDRDDLFRVRLGPFDTRDQAVAARSALESNGISAIVVAE